jgi:hypothetical protein
MSGIALMFSRSTGFPTAAVRPQAAGVKSRQIYRTFVAGAVGPRARALRLVNARGSEQPTSEFVWTHVYGELKVEDPNIGWNGPAVMPG